jgi:hypothetical protein
VLITDLVGKAVMHESKKNKLDISRLSKGIYLVNIIDGNNNLVVVKINKN